MQALFAQPGIVLSLSTFLTGSGSTLGVANVVAVLAFPDKAPEKVPRDADGSPERGLST